MKAGEADGVLTNAGYVRLSGATRSNVVVTLASDDLTELLVPATVTIPAGDSVARFNLTLVDDPTVDGTQMVHVSATASGFLPGTGTIRVLDDESPPEPLNPAPAHLVVNVSADADLSWSSGQSGPGTAISNDVYFGTTPTPGPGQFLGRTTNTAWTLPRLAPLTTYYWQVVARRLGQTPSPVWQFTTRGVDHFDWNPIASPQAVGVPFPVTIRARDEFGSTVSNFTGTVALRGASVGSQQSDSNLVIETGSSIALSVRRDRKSTRLNSSHQ